MRRLSMLFSPGMASNPVAGSTVDAVSSETSLGRLIVGTEALEGGRRGTLP
jgi:hypothetical protein